MRVSEMRNDAGVVTGFEVRSRFLSRRRACKLAGQVPGARVRRGPRPFVLDGDDFCAFDVDGVPFLIIEPFGDSDRFWVVAEEPSEAAAPLIARVRVTFERGAAAG